MAETGVNATDLPDSGDRALAARALAWLAQREYSRQELRNKLMRLGAQPGGMTRRAARENCPSLGRGPAPDSIQEPDAKATQRRPQAQRVDAVLDWLERHQHLSEQRFAESRLHLRSERFGNLRIRQELAQHGVQISTELEASLRASELERARAVWERKFGGRAVTPADTAKQVRFLAGRGFSGDVIRRVLRALEPASPVFAPPDPDQQLSPGGEDSLGDAPQRLRTSGRLRLVSGGLEKPENV